MTYHDGEVLTYAYDSGGLPRAATGKKLGITYPYVEKLEYDKFEQRAFLREGNGVETAYTYNPLDRRLDRLQAGAPNDPNGDFQDLSYSYDDVGNILKLDNTAKIPKAGEYGGPVTQTFQYDGLYRLTKADGTWRYDPNKKSVYSFSQSYDTIHNITKKTQTHDVETPGGATVPQKKTSYDLTYSYASSHPHAPTKISGTDDVHKGGRTFEYDKNGNQLGFDVINSGQKRSIVWDEENRIQEIHDNGRTSRFKYNDAGERVIKRTEQGETAYVNQFWTVRNRSVGTKHIFVGETRIASKLVPGEDHVQPESLWSQTLGGWWKQLSQGQKPFKNPHFTGSNMPQKLPEDNFVYFYHPDHVGSTSYVTDKDGELYEHVQYFPFGETWVHEHSNTEKLPYLYTSKELDEETGLYYFGARYYDPRTSVWQSADPKSADYLSGTPNGGVYVGFNLSVYSYARHSPLMFIDPTGMQYEDADLRAIIEEGDLSRTRPISPIVVLEGQSLSDIMSQQTRGKTQSTTPSFDASTVRTAPKPGYRTHNNRWVEGQVETYRAEWTPGWGATTWPWQMYRMHHQGAAYDYYMMQQHVMSDFEIMPNKWGDAADLGNYMAGYGAGYGPSLIVGGPQPGLAIYPVHAAGGYYNAERDTSGFLGDSKRSEYWIRQGFYQGLVDNLESTFVPYWLRTDPRR